MAEFKAVSGIVKDDFIFLSFSKLTSVDQVSVCNRVPERMLLVDL